MTEAIGGGADAALVSAAAWALGAGQEVERIYATNAAGGDLDGNELANVMHGSAAGDTLDGAGGRDYLFGQGGADTLAGGAQNDVLDGGAANDTLTGGAGTDRFLFTAGSGFDTLTDFLAGAGNTDYVQVSSALLANFAAVQAAASDVNNGTTTAVEIVAGGTTFRLEGVLEANLAADDFLFV